MPQKLIDEPILPELTLFFVLLILWGLTSIWAVVVLAACVDIAISGYERRQNRRRPVEFQDDRPS